MNEIIEKLRAVLESVGVEPEKIEAALAALSEGEVEEPSQEPSGEGEGENPNPEEEPTVNEEEDVPPEVPNPEGEGEVAIAPVEEGVPADPASVPAAEPSGELPPAEIPPEEAGPVPPATPELPPMVSLEEFEAVKNDLKETKAANEGLKAQIESLVEALKSAGVISGGSITPVGEDNPQAPGNRIVDTTMDDVLREINRKSY